MKFINSEHYYTGSLFTPPNDANAIIAARSLGEQDMKLMAYYPQRFVYKTDGFGLRLIRTPYRN